MNATHADNPLLGPLSRADFIVDNMRLVYAQSNRFNYQIREDVASEGTIGLITAYDRYSDADIPFSTFATFYIRGRISRYFRRSSGPGRIPDRVYPLARQIMNDGLDDEPAEIIALKYSVTVKAARKALAGVLSRKAAEMAEWEEASAKDDASRLYVDEFLAELKPSQQRIVDALMAGKKMAVIAREMSVSKQAVHNSVTIIRRKWNVYDQLSA